MSDEFMDNNFLGVFGKSFPNEKKKHFNGEEEIFSFVTHSTFLPEITLYAGKIF